VRCFPSMACITQVCGVPSLVAARAGHSVEVLTRVYARCVTGLEDVWISRTEGALRLEGGQGAGEGL
jgi:hypothetical protein